MAETAIFMQVDGDRVRGSATTATREDWIAVESVNARKFCFDVEIAHPLTGLIVRYRGWLVAANHDT